MTTSSVDFSQIKELLGDDWLSSSIELEDLRRFRRQFKEFFKSIGTAKTESLKEQAIVNAIQDLMKDTIVKNGGYLDSNQGKNYDMVVRSTDKNIVTLIECKRVRASELSTNSNLNKKSLQQLIYYFLKENMDSHHAFRQSLYLGRVMISDGFTWLVWNAEQFYQLVTEKFDYDSRGRQVKLNKIYDKIVKSQDNYPVIKQYIEQNEREKKFQETCYMLDLHNLSIEDLSAEEWEILYHFFSGAFWLDRDAYFDPNTLHDGFYKELLHIMGLQEVAKDGLKVIIPNPSITNSMYDAIHSRLDEKVSTVMNEYVFELMILWVNRILFLKLFEAHIINVRADKKSSNHRGSYEFMSFNPEQITSWNDLNDLFFHVLSKEKQERGTLKKKCFEHVPYLNSALFMKRDIKDENNEVVLSDEISSLDSEALVVLYKDTVLSREGESLPLLEYLLKFLKAYDFSSDGQAKRRQGSKKIEDKLINASVLGKVFEKLNGYKDGSFYTPSFITAYLCKESIQQALVARVNEQLNEEFSNYQELKEEFEDWKKSSPKAVKVKEIITNFTILDPAVGSGHFLVSALNEMIQIRYDFKMIKELKDDFTLTILNDEVMIYNAHNYKPEWYTVYDLQTQVFQQELFRTKQEIIEKNLFGVDINPSSVEICRLRLWIELLKSSYYIVEGSDEEKGEIGEKLRETLDYVPMATLPNIDIKVEVGNSLAYTLPLDDKEMLIDLEILVEYQDLRTSYYQEKDKRAQKTLLNKINDIKNNVIPKLLGRESNAMAQVEWRLHFPESLEEGRYIGYNVVVANPPYIFARGKRFTGKEKEQYHNKFELAKYQIHTYTLFIEAAYHLLAKDGYVGLLVPSNLLTIQNDAPLRKFIIERLYNKEILNLLFPVFEKGSGKKAGVDVLMMIGGKKSTPQRDLLFKEAHDDKVRELEESHVLGYERLLNNRNHIITLATDEDMPILAKIEKQSNTLGNFVLVKAGVQAYEVGKGQPIQTEEMKNTRVYHAKEQVDASYYKYLDGDVWRYEVKWSGLWIKYGSNLAAHRKPELFQGERLLVRQIPSKGYYHIFAGYVIEDNLINDRNSMIIKLTPTTLISIKYILGLISSRLMSYWFDKTFNKNSRGLFPQFKINELQQFPIFSSPTPEQEAAVVTLVDAIIAAKQAGQDSVALEQELDDLIFNLYNLTDEEVIKVKGI